MEKKERVKWLLATLVTLIALLSVMSCSSQKESLYGNGLAQIRAGKFDAAVNTFSELLNKNPADASARFGLGWAYQSKGMLDPAAQQYNLAITSAVETLAFSYFNLGVLFQAKKKYGEATLAYQRVLSIQPSNADAAYNLAFVYMDQGLDQLALNQFAETIKRKPTHAWANYHAGVLAAKTGKKEDAKKYLKKALELDASIKAAQEKLKALGG